MTRLVLVELPDSDFGPIDVASGLVRVGLGHARVADLFDGGERALFVDLSSDPGRYVNDARAALTPARSCETTLQIDNYSVSVTLDDDGHYKFRALPREDESPMPD